MKTINVVHINFIVQVELTSVQDPGSSPKYSYVDFQPNTLNISYKTNVARTSVK